MNGLEIKTLTGSHAGRTVRLAESPITIGRSPDQTLVLDLDHVSRQHAELVFGERGWEIVNHSANGTRLGRWNVTRKPRLIGDRATIAIGGQDVLDITNLDAGSTTPGDAEATTGSSDAVVAKPRRSHKLWIGIGVYLLLMAAVTAFLLTLSDSDDALPTEGLDVALTRAQIADEVRRPLPREPANVRRMTEEVQRANTMWALADTEPDALYQANQAYKIAVAVSPDGRLPDPTDGPRSQLVRDRLTDLVAELYDTGYAQLNERRYREAIETYRDLLARYPAGNDSRVVQSVNDQWAAARVALDD